MDQTKILNFLRIIRGRIVRTLRPRASYFLFQIPERSVSPLSNMFGYDRGKPIDRYYIESFLKENKRYIKGRCLEITDNYYTKLYGGGKVKQSDILDINQKNKLATIYGDLRKLDNVKRNTYDCLVITQTYVMIDDFEAAIRESERILKPGGILLATMPCLAPVFNIKHNCWRFTVASSSYVFGKYFKKSNLQVKSYGNALAGQGFWVGLSIEDMKRSELDHNDSYFPLIVSIKAKKG